MYERPLRPDELMHYGVKGMKWGIRRYQNYDGSLTPAGARKLGRIKSKQYRNRENYNKAKKSYDKWNNSSTFSPFKKSRQKKSMRRNEEMSKASKAMSELDLKNEKLKKKAEKLTSHTNRSIEGIDLNKSTKSTRFTNKSQKWLSKQSDKQAMKGIKAAKKYLKAEQKGDTIKMEKYRNRGRSYLRNLDEIQKLSISVNTLSKSKGQSEELTKKNYERVQSYVNSGKNVVESALGIKKHTDIPKDYYSLDPKVKAIQEKQDEEAAKARGRGMRWRSTINRKR